VSEGGSASSKKPLIIVLAVIGVLALILGILYLVAGNSLPSFLTSGSHVKSGNHLARGGVCLVVGVVVLIGSWLTSRNKAAASTAAS
jgi:uncharacterized membrane protein HdeD (DUF308 family)